MVFAVQALLGFRNTARRDAVKGNVETRLAQNVPWGELTLTPTTLRGSGDPAFYAEIRFVTKAEQQAFWADLQAAWGAGVNGPVTGSSAWIHDCPHDQPDPAGCVEGARVVP